MVSAAVAVAGALAASAASKKQANAAKKAGEATSAAANRATGVSQAQFNEAKSTIERNFQLSQAAQQLGAAGALDVQAVLAPTQIGQFQQGNIGAQQSLLAGLGAQNQALLGQPVDLSQLTARGVQVDPNVFQARLPDFNVGQGLLTPTEAANIVDVDRSTIGRDVGRLGLIDQSGRGVDPRAGLFEGILREQQINLNPQGTR